MILINSEILAAEAVNTQHAAIRLLSIHCRENTLCGSITRAPQRHVPIAILPSKHDPEYAAQLRKVGILVIIIEEKDVPE